MVKVRREFEGLKTIIESIVGLFCGIMMLGYDADNSSLPTITLVGSGIIFILGISYMLNKNKELERKVPSPLSVALSVLMVVLCCCGLPFISFVLDEGILNNDNLEVYYQIRWLVVACLIDSVLDCAACIYLFHKGGTDENKEEEPQVINTPKYQSTGSADKKKRVCPNCYSTMPVSFYFCPKCGTKTNICE